MMGEEAHSGSDDEDGSHESTELKGFLSKWTNCELQIADKGEEFHNFSLQTFTAGSRASSSSKTRHFPTTSRPKTLTSGAAA